MACPKILSTSLTQARSDVDGRMNRATSSAKIDNLCMALMPEKEESTPSRVALSITAVSMSMAMKKSSGELGPPCLRPRA